MTGYHVAEGKNGWTCWCFNVEGEKRTTIWYVSGFPTHEAVAYWLLDLWDQNARRGLREDRKRIKMNEELKALRNATLALALEPDKVQ